MRFLVVLAATIAVAAAIPIPTRELEGDALASYTYEDYLAEFGKQYDENDIVDRRGLFEKSKAYVKKINSDPTKTWKAGLNKFSDMTAAEKRAFKGFDRGSRLFPNLATVAPFNVSMEDVPASIDWRKQGVTTPVKDQGMCGSCWAFSTIEVVESAVAIASKKLLTLSEQQLVSCAGNPKKCGGTGGCEGNVQWQAMQYIIDAGGITDEQDYKYTARDSKCSTSKIQTKATIDGVVRLPANDGDALKKAVGTIGPIAISVAADAFFSYSSGVFGASDPSECGWTIDHAVVAEGYGEDTINGKAAPYWLVRNSWGRGWGEEGYIRIYRQDSDATCGTDTDPASGSGCQGGPSTQKVCGVCGILSDSSYPTGAKLA